MATHEVEYQTTVVTTFLSDLEYNQWARVGYSAECPEMEGEIVCRLHPTIESKVRGGPFVWHLNTGLRTCLDTFEDFVPCEILQPGDQFTVTISE